ncbi:MAG: FtsH protease activity modulator HflK [Deltaproteobacteria bacterium]|nr:FtsH protease activity modulator HflK [Candidatus Anaeroferrophillacea bacterium]
MPWEYDGGGGAGHDRQPPDLDELLRRIKARLPRQLPGGFGVVAVLLLAAWMVTGVYIVSPDEIGVVKRFGKVAYTTKPGPHWHLPVPLETVMKPKVTQVKRVEIGFRTIAPGPPARYQAVPNESLMLTGDENIVDAQFIVQYRIKDPVDYLFNVAHQTETVKDAAEAAMREVIGKSLIDEVLTGGKFRIQQETKDLLQGVLDRYVAGIMVVAVQLQDVHPPKAVIQAFQDVASAKENKIKLINEAESYRNDALPRAKGQAAEMLNQAQAEKEEMINVARGDAARFLSNLRGYRESPSVTRRRMYLETMEEILPRLEKIVVGGELGSRVVPLLPLGGGLTVPVEKQP